MGPGWLPFARGRVLTTLFAALVAGSLIGGCAAPSASPSLGLSAAPSASLASSVTPAATPAAAPLRDVAGTRLVGTALNVDAVKSDSKYAEIAAREFSSITPENAMKWAVVEPTRGTFDWSGADAVVAFAQAHNQKVHGHTLVWHNQLPTWLTSANFTKDQLNALLKDHITTEVGRYAGKIAAWDVVNEVIDDNANLRDSVWSKTLGKAFIADAFKWAHAADPSAKLYINDYNIEGAGAKSDAEYALVKDLLAAGVPINGVGIQGHLDLQYDFPSGMADNIKRFTDLGLEVSITEADVRFTLPATADQLAKQADYYRQMAEACAGNDKCVNFTVWGFGDKYSWVPFSFPGEGAACLYDDNMAPKPAYGAVEDALKAGKP